MRFWVQGLLIYMAALLQGAAAVMVPASGALLVHGRYHDLAPSEYGSLFVAMAFGAVMALLGGSSHMLRRGMRSVYLAGLLASAFAMALFALTNLFFEEHLIDLALLLAAMLFLGIGIGSAFTVLNTYVVTLFPGRAMLADTFLYACFGIGMTAAPLLLSHFMEQQIWWMAPFVLAVWLLLLFVVAGVLLGSMPARIADYRNGQPKLAWQLVIVAGLYGFCETVFSNWAAIYLTVDRAFSFAESAEALALFWAAVTVGRLIASCGSSAIPVYVVLLLLPLLIAVGLWWISTVDTVAAAFVAYAFAGLACSALLPSVVAFGRARFYTFCMAAYMIGYGLSAYAIGTLHDWFAIPFTTLFVLAAVVALIAWFLMLHLWRQGEIAK